MVKGGSSYLSQSELPVTFGLGREDRIERAVIYWPSGINEEHKNLAAGKAYECTEGKGIQAPAWFLATKIYFAFCGLGRLIPPWTSLRSAKMQCDEEQRFIAGRCSRSTTSLFSGSPTLSSGNARPHYILEFYNQNVSDKHLDIGVGTGYFLDRGRFPSSTPQITLMDLNENSLEKTAKPAYSAIVRETYPRNVLEPIEIPDCGIRIDRIEFSAALSSWKHGAKQVGIRESETLLRAGGVIFGTTILGAGGASQLAWRHAYMQDLQLIGSFQQLRRSPRGFGRWTIKALFGRHEVTTRGCISILQSMEVRSFSSVSLPSGCSAQAYRPSASAALLLSSFHLPLFNLRLSLRPPKSTAVCSPANHGVTPAKLRLQAAVPAHCKRHLPVRTVRAWLNRRYRDSGRADSVLPLNHLCASSR